MTNYYHSVFFTIIFIISAILVPLSLASVNSIGNFNNDFFISWAPTHVNTSVDGKIRSLKLDQESGSGFDSNSMFLFGQIDMQIKLIPGSSAGSVVAYYLASDSPNRDEIDLEFLGNVSGQPYILQTNIYSHGFGDREERIYLWFDPSADFHTYSILWNIYQIVIMVDWVPIRVFRNHKDKGISFPISQPMSIKASLWNGEDWATRGGKDKINWSKAPFIASFRNYKIDACVWRGNPKICKQVRSTNWWNKEKFNSLNWNQRRFYRWVRKYHLIYDYCQDNQRFSGNLPKECSLPKY
ncbi:probable xyloglucan endotransglucosylase/hydrolase protein 10 [Beta vulgaris subsp. vulgaris]|uniref:probable xyloglucan endotransglucosylase/hydrolase protein 10 n=1 Tax=Beta vulgaris subsp. vulgaris TaxID=3555 RepID=UPI002036E560|nr:probable xyloglucan endotransglucosylase/hydrolase protein 10 [Beta vulgaris subsp. vulgaris]